MDKLKNTITKKIQDLGESINTSFDEDARMEDMSEYVLNPYEGSSSFMEELNNGVRVLSVQKKKVETRNEVQDDQDIMDSIDASYFIDDDDFNAIDYELKKPFFPESYLEDLGQERLRLKSQLQVVSKKISVLIMEKSPSYSGQIEDMDDIRKELGELLQDVQSIRSSLAFMKRRSSNCLKVLANEKKKRMLKKLRSTLLTIKTLHETEYQLRDAIQECRFPLAIRICIEAREAATTYSHFSCVSDLMVKLVGTTNIIEQELDSALSSMPILFDLDRYSFVYNAYCMLKKREHCSRKLIQFFISTCQTTARSIIRNKLVDPPDVSNFTFEDICKLLSDDCIVTSIGELCFVLCKILSIYHYIIKFHMDEAESNLVKDSIVLKMLTSSIYSVFDEAHVLLNTLLCSQDFSTLKFDNILDIVDKLSRFRQFGRLHFGHSSLELAISLEKQTVLYFMRYHRDRLEELRMFLENETFTTCPVPSQFTIFDLQDFQFLKERTLMNTNTEPINYGNSGEQLDYTIISSDFVNPFSIEDEENIGIIISPTSKTSNSKKEETTEEVDDHVNSNLCNTALNLLRFFGRYIRMTSLLPTIAENSLPALCELFEFFLYSICNLFGNDGSETMDKPVPLATLLDDLHSKFSGDPGYVDRATIVLTPPSLCHLVQLEFSDRLFGAAERIVAIESIEFVAKQVDLVRPVIENLVATNNVMLLERLDRFYAQVVTGTSQVRSLVVDAIASRSLKLPALVQSISSIKWDIDDLRSHHSTYVDLLIKDFEGFKLRVSAVGESVTISKEMNNLLWNRVIYYAFKALVQGFCESGKCSTEGRALMQLDFQHILIKLEVICGMKPIPHSAFVDGYIKAFYLPESGLEQWISQHTEYTSRQMISLLGVATHVSKKAKSRIINALNE